MAVAPPPDGRPPTTVRTATRLAMAAAVVAFGLLACGGRPTDLLERGPFTSDFFDAQAHALLDGHLDVDPDVAGIEGFVHDGRTQLYFGIVPALLRLPVAALTERFDGRLSIVSMLAAVTVATWAASRLAWRARRRRRGDGPPGRWEPWIVGGFAAAAGLASPLLFLAARPVVYHETELWGAATTLLALEALLAWWEHPGRRSLVLASVAATAAFSTRASVGGGAVAALALTAGVALVTGRVPRRRAGALALAVLVPLAAYAAVNQARFDTPFGVPFEEQVLSGIDPARQATLASTGGGLFGLEFAPTAIVTYARPDGVSLQRLFPWITFREGTRVLGDATFDTLDRSASVPTVAPSLTLLALVGLWLVLRRGWRDPWLAATVGAASGLAATVTIAFIANRYLADVTPVLVLLASMGTWAVADGLRRAAAPWRPLAVAGLAGLTGLGTLTSVALALQSQRLFILPAAADRLGFVGFQYDLFDRLGGERPPGVRRAGALGPAGPRGEVVVLDGCRGLYWSDAKRWWPLELGGDDGVVVEGPAVDRRTVLLRGDGWRLVAEPVVRVGAARLRLVYEHDDGRVRAGEPIDREVVDGRPLRVLLDRANGELTVRSGDRDLLVAWLVTLDGPIEAGPGRTLTPAPTPLCDELAARL